MAESQDIHDGSPQTQSSEESQTYNQFWKVKKYQRHCKIMKRECYYNVPCNNFQSITPDETEAIEQTFVQKVEQGSQSEANTSEAGDVQTMEPPRIDQDIVSSSVHPFPESAAENKSPRKDNSKFSSTIQDFSAFRPAPDLAAAGRLVESRFRESEETLRGSLEQGIRLKNPMRTSATTSTSAVALPACSSEPKQEAFSPVEASNGTVHASQQKDFHFKQRYNPVKSRRTANSLPMRTNPDSCIPAKKSKMSKLEKPVPIVSLRTFMYRFLPRSKIIEILKIPPDTITEEMRKQDILCKVCTAKSTGLHYGKIACEGCKSFFKRSVQSKPFYACAGLNYSCNVFSEETRNKCKKCRFRKCLEIGMACGAVRTNHMPGGRNGRESYNMSIEELDEDHEKIERENEKNLQKWELQRSRSSTPDSPPISSSNSRPVMQMYSVPSSALDTVPTTTSPQVHDPMSAASLSSDMSRVTLPANVNISQAVPLNLTRATSVEMSPRPLLPQPEMEPTTSNYVHVHPITYGQLQATYQFLQQQQRHLLALTINNNLSPVVPQNNLFFFDQFRGEFLLNQQQQQWAIASAFVNNEFSQSSHPLIGPRHDTLDSSFLNQSQAPLPNRINIERCYEGMNTNIDSMASQSHSTLQSMATSPHNVVSDGAGVDETTNASTLASTTKTLASLTARSKEVNIDKHLKCVKDTLESGCLPGPHPSQELPDTEIKLINLEDISRDIEDSFKELAEIQHGESPYDHTHTLQTIVARMYDRINKWEFSKELMLSYYNERLKKKALAIFIFNIILHMTKKKTEENAEVALSISTILHRRGYLLTEHIKKLLDTVEGLFKKITAANEEIFDFGNNCVYSVGVQKNE